MDGHFRVTRHGYGILTITAPGLAKLEQLGKPLQIGDQCHAYFDTDTDRVAITRIAGGWYPVTESVEPGAVKLTINKLGEQVKSQSYAVVESDEYSFILNPID